MHRELLKREPNEEMRAHLLLFVSYIAISIFHLVADTFFPRECVLSTVCIAQLLFSEAPSLYTKTNHNVNQLDLT